MKRKAHEIGTQIMDQGVRTPSAPVVEREPNMIQVILPNGTIFVHNVLKSFNLT